MKIVSVSDLAARAAHDASRTTLRLDNGAPQSASPDSAEPAQQAPADRRATLERELDRLQQSIQADARAAGMHLNWLVLTQALFANAFLIVLVLGARVPLPYSRWLLVGIAVVGVFCAVVLHASLRRMSDDIAMLRIQRRAIEMSLQSEFGRIPVFPTSRSESPSRAIPLIFLAAWAALVAYGLLLP